MPRRFLWWDSDLWFPLQMDPSNSDRSARSLTFMARLREGVTLEHAKSELDAMAQRVEREVGSAVPEYRNRRFVAVSLIDEVIRNVRPTLIALQTAVILILLIACANVANLLLVDLMERSREFAVRLALGAERKRILLQVLVEALVLSLFGGLLGFLLASWSTRLIVGLIPYGFIPAETEISMDGWTFLVTLAISLLVGVLVGFLPALQLLRSNVGDVLKEGGRPLRGGLRTSRLRSALVVSEMALGLVLVFAASLMIQTFLRLTSIDPGFDSANVMSMRIDLAEDRYTEPSRILDFHDRLLERLRALPEVRSAAAALTLPLTQGSIHPITFEGRPGPEGGGNWEARYQIVAGDYFRTLRIPLVRGRYLDERDTAEALPVTVINESMADRFFPGENPVGKRLKRGGPEDVQYSWLTIVGIVEDVKDENLEKPAMPVYHVPLAQAPVKPRNVALLVRTAGEPEAVAEPIRRAVLELDPEQPVFEVQTLEELVKNTLGGRRTAVVLLTVSALLALLLGTIGIFAVMAHSVSQRTQEIGLRMALGAMPRSVFRLVLGQALKLAAVGIVVGVVAAAVSSRLLATLVYGVGTRDPLTLVGVSLLFVTVAVLASFLPARRATRVAPAVALQPR
jgi:putative ABC transport system permease protein